MKEELERKLDHSYSTFVSLHFRIGNEDNNIKREKKEGDYLLN